MQEYTSELSAEATDARNPEPKHILIINAYRTHFTRAFDIPLSLILMVIALPVVLALWMLVRRDDPPVTKVGLFLKATSLDELPQIWNVLRGEMSFVDLSFPPPEFRTVM